MYRDVQILLARIVLGRAMCYVMLRIEVSRIGYDGWREEVETFRGLTDFRKYSFIFSHRF